MKIKENQKKSIFLYKILHFYPLWGGLLVLCVNFSSLTTSSLDGPAYVKFEADAAVEEDDLEVEGAEESG